MRWVKLEEDSIINLEHARSLFVQMDTDGNAVSWEVVADFGDMRVPVARFETREKALRDELIRRGVPAIEGAVYDATITEAARWTLDTKTVKAEMGAAWYDARCRQSLVATVKTTARAAAMQIAA